MKYYLTSVNDGYIVCFDDDIKQFILYVKLEDGDITELEVPGVEKEVTDGKELKGIVAMGIRCGHCHKMGHGKAYCPDKKK